MRKINYIVVHCSATNVNQLVTAAIIDKWHKAQGWKGIGYHYVIRRDGLLETGRPEDEVGAHVQGHNTDSIGVCLAGGVTTAGKAENNFTEEQFEALKKILSNLKGRYPSAEVLGHRDLSPDLNNDGVIDRKDWVKECPCFDVRDWLKSF